MSSVRARVCAEGAPNGLGGLSDVPAAAPSLMGVPMLTLASHSNAHISQTPMEEVQESPSYDTGGAEAKAGAAKNTPIRPPLTPPRPSFGPLRVPKAPPHRAYM